MHIQQVLLLSCSNWACCKYLWCNADKQSYCVIEASMHLPASRALYHTHESHSHNAPHILSFVFFQLLVVNLKEKDTFPSSWHLRTKAAGHLHLHHQFLFPQTFLSLCATEIEWMEPADISKVPQATPAITQTTISLVLSTRQQDIRSR